MPPNAVYVGRPTMWGNPFKVGDEIPFLPGRKVADARHAASLYLGHAPLQARLISEARDELKGKDLACWCSLRVPCHADTLLEIANPCLSN